MKHAQVSHKEHNLLPHVRRFDKQEKTLDFLPIAVYLDNLRSAHNVGSIVRTVEAFSLGSIHFSPQTPFIDQKQVQNTSMGAYQWVKCFENASLLNLPKPLIALETCRESTPLAQFRFPIEFTLAMGNEEYGCSPETLKAADFLVEIPLFGRKNSLNVANALAIVAAEIRKQYPENPKKGTYEKDS